MKDKYSSYDTLSQLPMNIHRTYQRNLTRVSYVLRGIKRAIWRKLVKISDCRVSSFLKALPGCRVSRHNYKEKSNNEQMKDKQNDEMKNLTLNKSGKFLTYFSLRDVDDSNIFIRKR